MPDASDRTPIDQHHAVRNEQGLARQLSAAQQMAMALGGAIGTGLFLASGLSVNVAGPAVILSYAIVAGISLLLGRALTEMAVAHPTAGAFGVYAGMYISPFAGYAVRVSYWLMQVIATGAQLVAASIYMGYWFPGVPGAVWVLAFSVVLLYANSRTVGRLGTIESWLVLVKVGAVALFAGFALLIVLGLTGEPAIGLRNLAGQGGFLPFGLQGSGSAAVSSSIRSSVSRSSASPRGSDRPGPHDSGRHATHGPRPLGHLHCDDHAAAPPDAVEPAGGRRKPLMIFVTHIAYRASAAGGGKAPLGSWAGAALISAILVSTGWVPDLRSTLITGGPWLLLLAIGYRFSAVRHSS